MSLANLFPFVDPEHCIIRIAVIPQGVNLDEVIREIIVKSMQRLEGGVQLQIGEEVTSFLGSLFCILGDHKGTSLISIFAFKPFQIERKK